MAIVVIVAFPVGILSCSIGTTHFLVSRNEESTILKCLNASFSNAWAIWKFHAIDGYITIDRILERLPKENDTRTPADIALEEAAYYAWKVGTAGMVPNLILGNKLIPSGISSINFVKSKFKEGYMDYCNRVNRWIPKIRGLNKTFSENEFKLKKIIYKEYNTTFVWTVGATLLFAYNNFKIKGDIQPDLVYYYSTLIFLSSIYLITRFFKKREQRNKTYKIKII